VIRPSLYFATAALLPLVFVLGCLGNPVPLGLWGLTCALLVGVRRVTA